MGILEVLGCAYVAGGVFNVIASLDCHFSTKKALAEEGIDPRGLRLNAKPVIVSSLIPIFNCKFPIDYYNGLKEEYIKKRVEEIKIQIQLENEFISFFDDMMGELIKALNDECDECDDSLEKQKTEIDEKSDTTEFEKEEEEKPQDDLGGASLKKSFLPKRPGRIRDNRRHE